MARATKAQSEATAAAVLAVAREAFATEGYAAVGLEEVAARAGVTRGAVYHHYGSKSGLFEAALGAVQREVGAAVAGAAAQAGEGWPGIEAGCRAFLAASLAEGARRILLLDGPAVLGWAAWRRADAANAGRLLQEGLGALAAAGELATGSVEATTALLSGAMDEAVLWIAGQPDPDAAAAEAWQVLAHLLASLRREGPVLP